MEISIKCVGLNGVQRYRVTASKVVGCLAVHKSLTVKHGCVCVVARGKWTITHILSGYAVKANIPLQKVAVALA